MYVLNKRQYGCRRERCTMYAFHFPVQTPPLSGTAPRGEQTMRCIAITRYDTTWYGVFQRGEGVSIAVDHFRHSYYTVSPRTCIIAIAE